MAMIGTVVCIPRAAPHANAAPGFVVALCGENALVDTLEATVEVRASDLREPQDLNAELALRCKLAERLRSVGIAIGEIRKLTTAQFYQLYRDARVSRPT